MQLIPSIDLRGGRCVRLLKGAFDAETRYEIDPAELLDRYADWGARWLHVVDLDGARDGMPANLEVIARLAAKKRLQIQSGGGLRSQSAIDAMLQAGVSRVVLGSVAVEEPELARGCLERLGPDRLCLAIDVRVDEGGVPRVRTRGWVTEHALSLWDLLAGFAAAGLKHVLCTDIELDGALGGPNLALYREARERYPDIEWQASGGVRDITDLARLDTLGMAAAISGKALLEGRFQPEELRPFLPAA
ncbi:MAG: 1-(5-phosphoribosyl)-5-[(5-phosphoribosylamino)methylideneamino] imidazole-4-carboxamide isomerase [Steroidobacteraceae bacterium]